MPRGSSSVIEPSLAEGRMCRKSVCSFVGRSLVFRLPMAYLLALPLLIESLKSLHSLLICSNSIRFGFQIMGWRYSPSIRESAFLTGMSRTLCKFCINEQSSQFSCANSISGTCGIFRPYSVGRWFSSTVKTFTSFPSMYAALDPPNLPKPPFLRCNINLATLEWTSFPPRLPYPSSSATSLTVFPLSLIPMNCEII